MDKQKRKKKNGQKLILYKFTLRDSIPARPDRAQWLPYANAYFHYSIYP